MSSSFLLLRLLHLTWMVCVMGRRWPYNCCFLRCCFRKLFKTADNILVLLPSCLFFMYFLSLCVLSTCCMDIVVWASLQFGRNLVLFYKINQLIHIIHNIAFHVFVRLLLTSLLVDEILLLWYVNWSTNFRGLLLRVEVAFLFKRHEFCFICVNLEANASYCLL